MNEQQGAAEVRPDELLVEDADVLPFDHLDEQQSPTELAQYIAAGLAAEINPDTELTTYEEAVSDRPPVVDKDQLVGQPYIVFGVMPRDVVKDIETGEIGHTLVLVAAQPVRLDRAGKVTERGRAVIYVAGRDDSVHGREMLALGTVSAGRPVLIEHGLTKRPTAAGNFYFTVEPEAGKRVVELFPRP